MMMKKQPILGFTLIELLIVVSVIALLGGATTPFLSRFVLQVHFDSTAEKIESSLRKAQSHALDNKNNATWGVCMSGTTLRMYSGTCANPSSSENFSIPTTISLTGLSDISFNSRGEPTVSSSITVSSSLESSIISINSSGGVEIN